MGTASQEPLTTKLLIYPSGSGHGGTLQKARLPLCTKLRAVLLAQGGVGLGVCDWWLTLTEAEPFGRSSITGDNPAPNDTPWDALGFISSSPGPQS